MATQRNSSIELLRIMAMVMILFHHYSVHGNFDYGSAGISYDRLILSVIQLGEWAVNILVIIFAYFSVKSKFKPKNILRKYQQRGSLSAICVSRRRLCLKNVKGNITYRHGTAHLR